MDVSHWKEQEPLEAGDPEGETILTEGHGPSAVEPISSGNPDLEAFRRSLEGLL